eukprot:6214693-Pleurochrysis_carterae.AAC.2
MRDITSQGWTTRQKTQRLEARLHNRPAKRRPSATSAGASSSAANAPLPAPSVLTPAVPAAAAAPTPVLAAPPQLQPPPPEQSPTWLLERPAKATRRRRLNRAGCQRLSGLPCACVACTIPISHAVAQPPPNSAPTPAAAPSPASPPAQP